MSGTQAEYQREAINRRAKSMAIAQPFFQIENTKPYAGLDLAPYDLRRICLVILDEIILQMGGVRHGATIEEILSAVRPVLTASTPNITPPEADRVTSYVLDGLTNEKQRQAFRVRYQIQESIGDLAWRAVTFKLVDVRESPVDSQIVFYASSEAINFFLSALEVDIEAEQAARDAAREYFMRHGRYEEAALVADENRKRTIQFRMRILQALAAIERNIWEVNFVEDVIPVLKQARDHIEDRLTIELSQKDDVEGRMDEATGEALRHLAGMREIFESSIAYNTALISDVLAADGRYLKEHSRQKFRARSGWEYADPYQDVLRPLLLLPADVFWNWQFDHWHLFTVPTLPDLPSFPETTAMLLQDPLRWDEQQPPAGEEIERRSHPSRFTEDDGRSADTLLDSLPAEFTLSEAFAASRAAGQSQATRTLVGLRALQWFERNKEPTAEVCGRQLVDADFCGDDLLLRKGERP